MRGQLKFYGGEVSLLVLVEFSSARDNVCKDMANDSQIDEEKRAGGTRGSIPAAAPSGGARERARSGEALRDAALARLEIRSRLERESSGSQGRT